MTDNGRQFSETYTINFLCTVHTRTSSEKVLQLSSKNVLPPQKKNKTHKYVVNINKRLYYTPQK